MATVLAEFEQQMDTISRIRQQRSRISGRATVRGKRVTVLVDVEGVVLETKFGANVADLDYRELAKAVTEAARLAAADAARQARVLMAPLLAQRARMPRLHEFVDGMPDLTDQLPEHPLWSAGIAEEGVFDCGAAAFAEVDDQARSGVTDTGW
ncbi:YbaB/EbfC family nucleoid-associated protein [Nocardia iowensis]|uniref:YbaB/EbfC family nucleoid-associated protein n=1 Tax=Nocardia iowensis TaxID=204891 RepID=A0ABX8S1S2_NOCIO|nr:YbaB/EbfC family nucleoid-associated protein [Nocardia iowensis]